MIWAIRWPGRTTSPGDCPRGLGAAARRSGLRVGRMLDALLSVRGFTLVDEVSLGGVLRQNPREYDYFDARVTVWIKS